MSRDAVFLIQDLKKITCRATVPSSGWRTNTLGKSGIYILIHFGSRFLYPGWLVMIFVSITVAPGVIIYKLMYNILWVLSVLRCLINKTNCFFCGYILYEVLNMFSLNCFSQKYLHTHTHTHSTLLWHLFWLNTTYRWWKSLILLASVEGRCKLV